MADHVIFPRSRPKMYQADKSHASPTLTQCLITPCPKCMWHSECRWYNPPDFIVFSEYPGSERCPRSESNALFLFSPPSLAFTARRGRGTVDKVIIVPYPDQTLTPCCHISKTGRYIFSYSSEDTDNEIVLPTATVLDIIITLCEGEIIDFSNTLRTGRCLFVFWIFLNSEWNDWHQWKTVVNDLSSETLLSFQDSIRRFRVLI